MGGGGASGLRIGNLETGGDSQHQWLGYIDEVRLSDTVLSESELLTRSGPPPAVGTVVTLK